MASAGPVLPNRVCSVSPTSTIYIDLHIAILFYFYGDCGGGREQGSFCLLPLAYGLTDDHKLVFHVLHFSAVILHTT